MRRSPVNRAAALACAVSTVTLLALLTVDVGPSAHAGSATASRVTVRGQVGPYAFPGAATCRYTRNRLTAITFPAARAAARQQWAGIGQWVVWGARLQKRVGSGPWRTVGRVRYAGAQIKQAGSPTPLPGLAVRRIIGDRNAAYRVVHLINWYFNVRQENSQDRPIVQGQASRVGSSYGFGGRRLRSCPGVNQVRLPAVPDLRSDELDRVRVSFSAGTAGVRYGLRGRLPAGLALNRRTGLVTGTVNARAADVTAHYKRIRTKAFGFAITATKNGRTTARSYRWVVFDTAYVMPSYTNRYGCGAGCDGARHKNISALGPKFAFGCTDTRPSSIPEGRTDVIYRQAYQREGGVLAPAAGRVLRYGDVLKFWYYPCSA